MKKQVNQLIQKYSLKNIYFVLKSIIVEQKIKFEFNNLYNKKNSQLKGIKKNNPRKLIISITSFPKRFNKLHLVLYSLLTQTLRPNKIILVLSKQEIEDERDIPDKILFLKKLGLDIKFVKENYKSYNKLIFTLKDFPNYNIVTVDDDIIYPKWFLEKLYIKHKKYSKDIICYRAHLIKKEGDKLKPYLGWMNYDIKKFYQGINLFPTGVSGVLYPQKSLSKEIFNSKVFLDICPLADDVWFKAMSLLNKINCRRIFENKNIHFPILRSTQETALFKENVGLGKNDKQIKKVFKKYNLNKNIILTE